jgi:benzoyl-CoA reductase/2-hydroxyglutaryl-CoA dehydratase subunit BcrC/BadD/HgdB
VPPNPHDRDPRPGSPALAALEQAYGGVPASGDGSAAPGPVIGYVGADVPVELITAAGALAVRLTGDPDADMTLGDTYLGRGLDPMHRSILARLLGGAYGPLDRLVVSHDCEASLRLFYAIRELRRVDPWCGLPETYLVDVLHLPRRTTARYNRRRVGEFADRLAAWTGRPIEAEVLARAVAAHDERRRLLAEAATRLRRAVPARLTGARFLAVANAPLPVDEHVALLRRLLAEADRLPEHTGRRVYLSGSDHDTPHVYRAIEAEGHVVVGEDHPSGDLSFERRVGDATLDALAEYYHHNGPTAQRATADARAAYTSMAAERCAADLLVAYARISDDAPTWDFPAQRAAVRVPAVLLDRQPYGQVDVAAMTLEVDACAR